MRRTRFPGRKDPLVQMNMKMKSQNIEVSRQYAVRSKQKETCLLPTAYCLLFFTIIHPHCQLMWKGQLSQLPS